MEKLQRCESGDQRWGLFYAIKNWERKKTGIAKTIIVRLMQEVFFALLMYAMFVEGQSMQIVF